MFAEEPPIFEVVTTGIVDGNLRIPPREENHVVRADEMLLQDTGIVGSFVYLLDQIAQLERPSSRFVDSLSELPLVELQKLLALAEAEYQPDRQRVWEIRTAIEMATVGEAISPGSGKEW